MEPVSGNSSSPANFLDVADFIVSAGSQTVFALLRGQHIPASFFAICQEAAVAVGLAGPTSNNSIRAGLLLIRIPRCLRPMAILIDKLPAVDTHSARKGTEIVRVDCFREASSENTAQHNDHGRVSTQNNGSPIFSVAAINDTLHRGRKPGLQLSQRLAPLWRMLGRHVALVKGREQGFQDGG